MGAGRADLLHTAKAAICYNATEIATIAINKNDKINTQT